MAALFRDARRRGRGSEGSETPTAVQAMDDLQSALQRTCVGRATEQSREPHGRPAGPPRSAYPLLSLPWSFDRANQPAWLEDRISARTESRVLRIHACGYGANFLVRDDFVRRTAQSCGDSRSSLE